MKEYRKDLKKKVKKAETKIAAKMKNDMSKNMGVRANKELNEETQKESQSFVAGQQKESAKMSGDLSRQMDHDIAVIQKGAKKELVKAVKKGAKEHPNVTKNLKQVKVQAEAQSLAFKEQKVLDSRARMNEAEKEV